MGQETLRTRDPPFRGRRLDRVNSGSHFVRCTGTVPANKRTELPPIEEGERVFRLDGMPVGGMTVRFEFRGTAPVQFFLVEEKTGLPSFPGLSTEPEPGRMQLPGEFLQGIPTDFTAIHRNVVVQATSR